MESPRNASLPNFLDKFTKGNRFHIRTPLTDELHEMLPGGIFFINVAG